MKKAVKIFLLIFILTNLVGGSYLGIRDYMQDKEYKDAYQQYNPMVKGDYDNKKIGGIIYLEDLILIGAIVTLGGITYTIFHTLKLRKIHSEQLKRQA